MSEALKGHLERIVYSNEHNNYTVAKLKVRGNPETVTVVGQLAGIAPGQVLKLSGDWETHPKYGRQFKAAGYSVGLPAEIHGIEKYLGSGLIKGIGPEMAKRLVERFGIKALDVIERSPDDLLGVEGIGEKRLQMIIRAWEDQREIRDVMIFLQGHGVSTGYSAKIFKQYGQNAIRVVRENPYRLASDIFGIGFLIADRIAEKVGISKDALIRAEAGILHVLEKISDEGHLFLPHDQLLDRAEALLEIDHAALEKAVSNLTASGRIVVEEFVTPTLPSPLEGEGLGGGEDAPSKVMTAVYLKAFYAAEVGLANLHVHDSGAQSPGAAFALSRLAHGPFGPTPVGIFRDVPRPVYEDDLERQIAEASESLKFERAARLRDRLVALRQVMQHQKIVATAALNQDAIALARDNDNACVEVFFVRNGKLLGREYFVLEGVAYSDDEEMMAAFLQRSSCSSIQAC